MACSSETLLMLNEILVDAWGGEVQVIDVSPDLNSIMVNVETPWGDVENYETIYKGSSKIYTKDEKTYSVHMVMADYYNGEYFIKIYVCYEFVEKLDTTLSMIYDSGASQTIEGGKLVFDVLLKSESNTILDNFDVGVYINNIYIQDIPGDWNYEHIVTADDVGKTLSFQTKFSGTAGFNSSQSTPISVTIPGKIGTNLTINANKTSVVIGETVSFTGTLKDEDNNVLPNKGTIFLVYKKVDNTYDYVLDGTGYKVISSTDSSGNYYRPWEPTEDYLDINTYAMWYDGDSVYSSTYSPDIILGVTVDECTQNIKIQDQDYNTVVGVEVTMNGITETTNGDGLVSFVNIIRNDEYTITKVYGEYSGEDIITGCKLDPQVLHIVIPDEPQCVDYITQTECEANNCYWWISNETCQSAPEGTTDYFDIHIKPYSWYEGEYEEALNSALALTVNLTGKIANYLSSITGYEYIGLEIKEDVNKNIIIVRIFLKDTSETSLVAPLVIAGLVTVVGAILIGIGYVIGTNQGGFSKSDITQLGEDIVRNAEIDAYEHAYDIDKNTATQLMDCLKTIETCDDSLTCFDNSGVTPSIANQLEVLVAYKTTIDAVYTGIADTVEDPEFEIFATEALADLEVVIQQLNSATITPEGAACVTTDIIDDTVEDLDEKQGEQKLDDCVFDIFGNCIITEGALGTIILIGAGLAAIAAYSAMKK